MNSIETRSQINSLSLIKRLAYNNVDDHQMQFFSIFNFFLWKK